MRRNVFGKQSIEYLGHVILSGSIAIDPSKVHCVRNWPIPWNVNGGRGFLGLIGYYKRFIKGYGQIVKPLTKLTKQEGFKWNLEAQQAFDELENKLSTFPVLTLLDFSMEFVVKCDVSRKGVGAVLMQD